MAEKGQGKKKTQNNIHVEARIKQKQKWNWWAIVWMFNHKTAATASLKWQQNPSARKKHGSYKWLHLENGGCEVGGEKMIWPKKKRSYVQSKLATIPTSHQPA